MQEYVYRMKIKSVKKIRLLEKLGFNLYKDEDGEEVVAKPIVLPFACGFVKNTKKLFEHFYKEATEEEKEDFKDFDFNEDGTVVITPEIKKEWTECQICFYTNGLGKNQLFINAPDHNQYFNSLVLDECAGEFINELLKDKIIYKAKVKH